MTAFTRTIILGTVILASAALAKEGVQDPTVKARQDLMIVQAQSAKTLGGMAGGNIAFDAAAAQAAKDALVAAAADIAAKFEPQATDPVSEAKPEIWANWADFTAKADALTAAATALDVTSVETIGAGMGAVGASCGGCHKAYRL